MRNFIPLFFVFCLTQASANNLNLNGVNINVKSPVVSSNVQKITSCSPRVYAQKTDVANVMYYSITKQPDLMAKYLIDKCLALNSPKIKEEYLSIKRGDLDIDLSNPLQLANSEESLLYMVAAKAPILKVDGKELVYSLAFLPTYFNQKSKIIQKKYGEESLENLKRLMTPAIAQTKIDISKLFIESEQGEESYDNMLATLIHLSPESVKVQDVGPGDYLVHHLAYFGRYKALQAVTEVSSKTITLNQVNRSGETAKMVAFRPYCAITKPWQKERAFKTQMLMVSDISYLDIYKKNKAQEALPQYILSYIEKNDNKANNDAIISHVTKKFPNVFNNSTKKLSYVDKSEYCQN